MNNDQLWLLKLLTLSEEKIFLTINSFEDRKLFFLMNDSEDDGTLHAEAALAYLFNKVFKDEVCSIIQELLWLFKEGRISTYYEGFKYLLVVNKESNFFWDVVRRYANIILTSERNIVVECNYSIFEDLLRKYNIDFEYRDIEEYYFLAIFSLLRKDVLGKGASRFYIQELKSIINNQFFIGLHEIFDGGLVLPCVTFLKAKEILENYKIANIKFIPIFLLNNLNNISVFWEENAYAVFEISSDFLYIRKLSNNLEDFINEILKYSVEQFSLNENLLEINELNEMFYYDNFLFKIKSEIDFKPISWY
ncbi:hypothetical protein [uncultured Acinetobacter sp.]|uniref:hypothetical protein n=1 Tax=uncultured Acinetobacter sp. TaxID=165433 RepID=UPI0025D862F8|nr:hypothetical protein [uncultured Acinetobacter sp.]